MSTVALAKPSLDAANLAPRRRLLTICPPLAERASHPPAAPGALSEPAHEAPETDAGAAVAHTGASPRAGSCPSDEWTAPARPPSLDAEVEIPESGVQAAGAAFGDELVAMLPSLERRAYRWCRDASEARDLAQDTVLRALGHRPRFDSDNHLRAWLFTVLRNLFISRRRREQSFQRARGELGVMLRRSEETAPPTAFLTPSIERALAAMPEAFARVLRLVDLEDYSYADAASALGVPVGTVMSRLFRARRRLARDLPALA